MMDYFNRKNIKPVLILAGIYFLVLIFVAVLIEAFKVELYWPYDGSMSYDGGNARTPTPWLFLVNSYIYLTPLIFSVIVARKYKPYMKNFSILLIIIVFIHISYGTATTYLREKHIKELEEKTRIMNNEETLFRNFNYEFKDNGEGILNWTLDTSSLENGHYSIYFELKYPGYRIGQGTQPLDVEKNNNLQEIHLNLNPQYFREKPSQEIELYAELAKSERVDEKILTMCGWAVFLCPTDRDGFDEELTYYRITRKYENIGKIIF